MTSMAIEKKTSKKGWTKARAKEILCSHYCECAIAFDTKDFQFDCVIDKCYNGKWSFIIYEHDYEVEIYSSDWKYSSLEETVKECKNFIDNNFKLNEE